MTTTFMTYLYFLTKRLLIDSHFSDLNFMTKRFLIDSHFYDLLVFHDKEIFIDSRLTYISWIFLIDSHFFDLNFTTWIFLIDSRFSNLLVFHDMEIPQLHQLLLSLIHISKFINHLRKHNYKLTLL